MKLAFLFLFFSFGVYAKPVVLVSYFDAFSKAPFNSSTVVAKKISELLKNSNEVDLRLCALRTIYDKSFYELEDCLKALDVTPDFVLSLGESNCNLKIEILARNSDKSKGPDNEGNERNNTPIDPAGAKEIGFTYPLGDMYCSLQESERKLIEVSNNAGSFVCNNLAYHVANNYPELKFGFIHVPANNCQELEAKTQSAANSLVQMIKTGAIKEGSRLPTKKKEFQALRESSRGNQCLSEFYKRTKGVDEKGLWGIFGNGRF